MSKQKVEKDLEDIVRTLQQRTIFICLLGLK